MHEDVLELLGQHRSIRKFKNSPLAPEIVQACVAAAQCAPTSSHVQAYSLIQIQDGALRAELATACGAQEQVAQAGAFFLVCADQRRHRLLGEDHGMAYEPNLETFLVDVIDASLFAQNLIVAFESRGLGICCIGGLRNDLPRVRELVELPVDVFPLFGLCVGEIDEPSSPRPRLAPQAVLFQERYPSDEELRSQIAEHDGRMAEHYAQRGLEGRTWSGGVARKFRTPKREGLKKFFEQQGARFC